MLRRYLLYLTRWQLSTPILAFCVAYFARFGNLWATVLANFIGGLIFFWVDQYIFTNRILGISWAVKDDVVCADCGQVARGYRLVKAPNYDRSRDTEPEFRCEKCSAAKTQALVAQGVTLE